MAKNQNSFHMPAEIQNQQAYDNAVAARIKANASKTRAKKWLDVEGNQRLHDWLFQIGEFVPTTVCSARTREEHLELYTYNDGTVVESYIWCECCRDIPHPLTKNMFAGDFGKVLFEMQQALLEWGGLTDKQTELVRKALERAEKWEAEREAKYAAKKAEDLKSEHVGTIGQRYEFDLVVERVHYYENDYGTTFINICRDASNNVIVYKGSNAWPKGEKIVCKATVKDHSDYEGVKQTMIQRPKVLSSE